MPRHVSHEIHISDVVQYKRCRRSWRWASPLRDNLTGTTRYTPFLIGTAVHHGLELGYRLNLAPEAALDAFTGNWHEADLRDLQTLQNGELYTLVIGMLNHYRLWQDRALLLPDREFEFLSPEHSFKFPLFKNTRRSLYLAGRFDGIVRHKPTNKIYIWEIKTTRSIAERKRSLWNEEQTTAYLWAASQLFGAPIAGVVYTLLRSKLPNPPDVLKTGMLSKRSSEMTPEYYLAAIRKHHNNPSDSFIREHYSDILQALINVDNPFFERLIVNRSTQALAMFQRELTQLAREMTDNRTYTYPTPGYHCGYCAFRAPCMQIAEGNVDGAVEILKTQYTPNTRWGQSNDE